MKNLVIGNTSQIAYYFPKQNFKFISSKNIRFKNIKREKWNKIFLCFAEQRTFLKNSASLFMDVNVGYTLKVISQLKNYCNKIIFYSTAELWNKENGPINLSTPFNYKPTPYTISKEKITEKLIQGNAYANVIVLFPFNFNSIHRKPGFLFSKIFNSIINKRKIRIENTYFYRELLHPKFVVEQSLNAITHQIIGSGRVTYVNDIIRNLYNYFHLKYDDYVIENLNGIDKKTENNICFLNSRRCLYTYKQLFEDTVKELKVKVKK